eukprot:TRINITY_DN536_c0_g1_i1.p1 TRINITY_DN536_c0_g1~~TRINITY_DN536_c0_g1_i1.p1  ORF type:complete len:481 (+),score=155.35 TRINITY_DN536_c0_g1_i1:105-1547(+)
MSVEFLFTNTTYQTSDNNSYNYIGHHNEDVDMGCAFSSNDKDTQMHDARHHGVVDEDVVMDPFYFESLPLELAVLVLKACDARDLLNLSQCSRDFYELCATNSVWRRLAKRNWNVNKGGLLKKCLPSWKLYYAQKQILSQPNIMQWIEVLPSGELPSKRYQHTASVVGDYVYFIGGQELPEKRFDEIFRLNTSTMVSERVTLASGAVPKYARHTAVTVGNKIFTFGGYDGINQHFQLCQFDPNTLEWTRPHTTGDVPQPRTNHSAASVGHLMYLFGGMYKEADDRLVFLDDFYVLDTITMHWRKIMAKGFRPPPRCGHRLLAFGDKILMFGGGSGELWDKKYNDVYIYDPRLNMWQTPTIQGAAPVCTFTLAFVTGPFLFLFGGQSLTDTSLTNDLFVLDTIAWTWTKMEAHGVFPTARDMGSGSMVGDSMYMFGGYCGAAIDTFFRLQMSPSLFNPYKGGSLDLVPMPELPPNEVLPAV